MTHGFLQANVSVIEVQRDHREYRVVLWKCSEKWSKWNKTTIFDVQLSHFDPKIFMGAKSQNMRFLGEADI